MTILMGGGSVRQLLGLLSLSMLVACDFSVEVAPEPALFSGPVTLGDGKGFRFSPLVADVNADGHLDIISTHRQPVKENSLRIWHGKGDGTFGEARQDWPSPGYSALAAGDFNRDGRLDLVAASHFKRIHTYLGDGAGGFDHLEQSAPEGLVAAGIVDIDGDGQDDLVTLGWEEAGILAYHGDGTGKWRLVTTTPMALSGAIGRDLDVGDLDNDGNADIVAAMERMGLAIFYGGGAGGWSGGPARISQVEKGQSFQQLALGDVNEDGYLDVALNGRRNPDPSRRQGPDVFLRAPDGSWVQSSHGLKNCSASGMGIALGDIDKDGHLDLIASCSVIDRQQSGDVAFGEAWGIMLFLGDGQGNWALRGNSGLPDRGLGPISGFALGDLNEDGRIDVVANHSDTSLIKGKVTVWLSR